MPGVTRPQGPLPARVYWVRRALVLGTAFVLVFSLARLLGGGSDGESTSTPQAQQAAGTPKQSDEPTAPASPATSPKKAKATRTPLAAPDGPCAPDEVTVSPAIDRAAAGSDVISIPLVVTTTREACTFVLSGRSVVMKITSGSDLIWSSQHCVDSLGEHDLVVRAAREAKVEVAWNGRRSEEECGDGGWAFKGGYHAIAAPLGGEPVDKYFELTKAQRAVVIKTRQPEPETKAERRAKRRALIQRRAQQRRTQTQTQTQAQAQRQEQRRSQGASNTPAP